MRKLPFIIIVLLITAFNACKTDFEVNEEWKEIDIVYCLLDMNDTAHYVKINKAYLNKNEDAYRLASIEDSIYHKDSLLVRMEEWRNGSKIRETILEKVYLSNKDSGIFSNPGQFLYRLPLGYTLDPTATYKLYVKNTSSGVEVNAETQIVNNAKITNPQASPGTINFKRGIPFNSSIITGKGAKFYDLVAFIKYFEYIKDTSTGKTDTFQKSIRWPIYSMNLTSSLNGGENKMYQVKGDDFYKMILDNIKIAPANVTRRLDKMEFHLAGGGEEIYYYLNVYKPTIGVIQKKPEYTNINNGQGIFSSRNRTMISVSFSPATIDEVKDGIPTRDLNFVK